MGEFRDGAYYPFGCGGDMSEGEYQAQCGLADSAGEELVDTFDDLPRGRWRTRDGRLLEIRTMSDAHVRNTLRFLERRIDFPYGKLEEFRAEAKRRGLA